MGALFKTSRSALARIRVVLACAALVILSACTLHRAAAPVPLVPTMEGTIRAWWPSQAGAAEQAAGFRVLRPGRAARRAAGLRLRQVDVEVAAPRVISYVFGDPAPDAGLSARSRRPSRQRWVIVTEDRSVDFDGGHHQPGFVSGTGTLASVMTPDLLLTDPSWQSLSITVECDARTDNALRTAQLVSQQAPAGT